jgi:hypothetical protein
MIAELRTRAQANAHDVPFRNCSIGDLILGDVRRYQLFAPTHNALGEKKPGGQLQIMARGTQSYPKRLTTGTHLKWLVNCKIIIHAAHLPVFALCDLRDEDAGSIPFYK